MDEDQLPLAIEALLFSSGRELSVREIAEKLSCDEKSVKKALRKLVQRYKKTQTSIEIGKAGTRYVMRLKAEYVGMAIPVAMPELEKDEIKTLALIAFYQPVKQSMLAKMVGSGVYAHIDKLRNAELINLKKSGATYTLTTTRKFLVYFGIPSTKKEEIRKWIASKVGIVIKEEPQREGAQQQGSAEVAVQSENADNEQKNSG